MKAIALVHCLVFLFSLSAFAQLEMSFKGGLNFSKIKTTNIENANNLEYESIVGAVFGPSARFHLNEKLSFNSDFLFSTRGYSIYDFKTTINYLELNILLSYRLIRNLDLEFGPDVGFKIFINSDQSNLSNGSFNFLDFGAATGLRYSLADKFILTARYYHGITSIAEFYKTASSESKTFNRAFQITIGYQILNRD